MRRRQGLRFGPLPADGAADQAAAAEGGGERGGGAGGGARHQVLGRHQALHPVPFQVGDHLEDHGSGGASGAVRAVGAGGLWGRWGCWGGGDETERAEDVAGGGAGEAGELPRGAFPQRDQKFRYSDDDEAQVFLHGNPGHDNGRHEDIEQRLRKKRTKIFFRTILCYYLL